MDDHPDRLCRTDRGDVGPAAGAQIDNADLTVAWQVRTVGRPNWRPLSFVRWNVGLWITLRSRLRRPRVHGPDRNQRPTTDFAI
jgi:hypothetical protein